jgi:S1-C subfamily serine protease
VVVRVAGRSVRGPEDLQLAVGHHPPGHPLELWVLRGVRLVRLEAVPTERADRGVQSR